MWGQIGCTVMFLGVFLGAFGAHALKDKLSEYHLDVYKTAILYHFIHGLALLALGCLALYTNSPFIMYSGIFFIIGIILFSGSLYTYSITKIGWLGYVAPFGAVNFLVGWTLLFLAFNIKG